MHKMVVSNNFFPKSFSISFFMRNKIQVIIYTCTHTHAYIQRESTAPPTVRPWLGAVSAESHVIDVVPWERSAPFSQKQRWRGKYRLRETACSYLVSDFSPFRYHLHYFMLNLVFDIYIFEKTIFCLFFHFFFRRNYCVYLQRTQQS